MSVAKVTEIIASSEKSFEHAIAEGVARATQTLENVRSAWVAEQTVNVRDNRITEYKVNLKITFVLND